MNAPIQPVVVRRIRLRLLKLACRVLLPRDVWVGKHFGAYTQRWGVMFGKVDSRGVMQGVLDKDA